MSSSICRVSWVLNIFFCSFERQLADRQNWTSIYVESCIYCTFLCLKIIYISLFLSADRKFLIYISLQKTFGYAKPTCKINCTHFLTNQHRLINHQFYYTLLAWKKKFLSTMHNVIIMQLHMYLYTFSFIMHYKFDIIRTIIMIIGATHISSIFDASNINSIMRD